MTHVWAFEWCNCVYESAFRVESLHLTAVGAYRAMKAKLLVEWDNDRNDQLVYGMPSSLTSQAWGIRKIEVLQ